MDQRINTLVGAAYIGCMFTGIASLMAALFPFFIGEFLPAGIFMIAAALSFGSLALALMKK